MNPGIFKTFKGTGQIPPYSLCTFDTENTVKLATDPTEFLLGTSSELGRESNNHVDICLGGLPEVCAGGVLATGDPITTDAKGRAIKATSGQRILGFALDSATESEIISYIFAPGYAG